MLYSVTMNGVIQMHDVVALLEDVPARHFDSNRPLLLKRGQMGTVVMTHPGGVFEIEFSGQDGKAYALLPIKSEKLIVLRDSPELASA